MEAIGHYDFGQNLKPVNFGGWAGSVATAEAQHIEFWLRYWHACYSYLLAEAGDSMYLCSFDAICEDPGAGLQALADEIGLQDPAALLSQSDRVRPPPASELDLDAIDPDLRSQVDALRRELLGAASFP